MPTGAPIDLAPRAAAVEGTLAGPGGAESAFRSVPGAYSGPAVVGAASGRCVAALLTHAAHQRHDLLWHALCERHQHARSA